MQLDAQPPGERDDADQREGAPDAPTPDLDGVRALRIHRVAAGEMGTDAPAHAGQRGGADCLRVARDALQRGLGLFLPILLPQPVAPYSIFRPALSLFGPTKRLSVKRLLHMLHAVSRVGSQHPLLSGAGNSVGGRSHRLPTWK